MTPKEMCNSCTHENYCMGAYRKDHWCGNHTRKDRKMPCCKDCKNKRYINNRYGNESIYVQSPCFMCKWNPTDNRVIMYEARKWAVAALNADTTQKNKGFVTRYKNILTSEGAGMIELPGNLKDILVCEDVSLSFKENRYYVTERQEIIAKNIFRLAKVSGKLMELMIPYKNATLLYGPPGTGKTMFGKYIAYKMGLPFCYLNFSKVVDSYMGVTSRNIAQAFTYASTNPCVFMLDEVDTISCNRERTSSGADREIGRVTVTLMQEFDKLANDVVVIAATNRLDILDKAFVSRCSQKYEMPPFTVEESKQMVNKFLNDIEISIPDIEIDQIVQKNSDQRTIMADVIRLIADRLEVEDENS